MPDHGIPEFFIVIGAFAKHRQFIVFGLFDVGGAFTKQNIDNILGFELLFDGADRFEDKLYKLLSFKLFLWVHTVIAILAIFFRVDLSEIVEQLFPAAHRGFAVGNGFEQQLLGNLLLGHRFAFKELFKFLDIFIAVESDAIAFAIVTTATAGLLIVAFQTFRHIVMDHEANIGLVDSHSKRDGSDNNIYLLHQELVLILAAC